jgi:hypothetical protein
MVDLDTTAQIMAEANRVARLVWPHNPDERRHILEAALVQVRADHLETRHSELLIAIARLAVAMQLARLDDAAGHGQPPH